MDKQEAIDAIETTECIDTLTINDRITGQQVDMVIKSQVLDIISQIDEPKKTVIPQFVADWIEKNKSDINTLYNAYTLLGQRKNDVSLWVNSNQDTFARAWLDGYDIEQEKLYTVEIPNPALDNLEFVIVLKRLRGRVCLVSTYDYMGRELSDEYRLTESEIRKDFEWAWEQKFAKEVEYENSKTHT